MCIRDMFLRFYNIQNFLIKKSNLFLLLFRSDAAALALLERIMADYEAG